MTFRFRLESVLDHRERIEGEKQRVYAEKLRAVAEALAERDRFVQMRGAQRDAVHDDHRSFDADRLRATYAHLAYLDRAIEDQDERLAACRAEAERAHAHLVGASKDRKVLETLKTRRRETYDASAALAEQRVLEDANARRFSRAQLERGPS